MGINIGCMAMTEISSVVSKYVVQLLSEYPKLYSLNRMYKQE